MSKDEIQKLQSRIEYLENALKAIIERGTPGGIKAAVVVTQSTLVAIAKQALEHK